MATRSIKDWQTSVDAELAAFRRNITKVYTMASPEAKPTVIRLYAIKTVSIDGSLGDHGFVYDDKASLLKLGVSGLDLIVEAGAQRGFYGFTYEDFCRTAVSLYLYHELHHVSQGLAEYDDVQALKRTAGDNKLGEMDTVADAVAAHIFALVQMEEIRGDREYYAKYFYQALHFMIGFCFPAFGFPVERRHKVQRALGIVLMTLLAEGAIRRKQWDTNFDAPLYPYFDKDFGEVLVLCFAAEPSQAVRQIRAKLNSESTKKLLEVIDSGDVAQILNKARALI